MELWIGALNLGLLYAFMTMGVFITFRIHNFPDITVDGSFTSGAAAAAVLIAAGADPFLALIAAFIVGAAAGGVTAVINTRFKVNGLLAGILVMTGLYSINLHIMGRSNIPLLNQTTFLTYLNKTNPGLHPEIWTCMLLLAVIALFWVLVSLFFKTDLGIAMRITGNNATMAAANGVHVNLMTVFGVALANGMVGVSGGLVAQYQGFADIGMGIGTIVIGLAAVIIGESVLKIRSMYAKIFSVILGSVIFRFMIAFALYVGMNPIDLKLLTAVFVLITLVVSKTVAGRDTGVDTAVKKIIRFVSFKRAALALGAVIIVVIAVTAYRSSRTAPVLPGKQQTIGFLQVTDHGLLDITRDSFLAEMQRLGYEDGKNCTIYLENANGDLPTVNTILDKFLQMDVDVVVPVSTACTQAAVNKIKDRPVVFATVANPFIIGAGKTETDHLPNVTGVYGWVPMDRTMKIVRKILPGPITVGAIWDPAHANSVFNVANLKKAVETYDDVSFAGVTITGSSEVYQAALSLVQKGIDAFVLSPDNIVYSAFESVVKAAETKNVPIFISDVERLSDGALGALGYDYTASGVQAAHMVDRVLKGSLPADMPFERYKKITLGFNLDVAQKRGITIPPSVLSQATSIHETVHTLPGKKRKIGIVQFALEPNVELCKKGIVKALEDSGFVDKQNVDIIYKNAQADFSLINAIIQDFIRRKVDIIVPLSTPCVQSAVQFAGGRDDTTVVFTYIYDPYTIGAAATPTDHVANMTGISCFPPVEAILDLIHELFPVAKVGVVWNSSEANSEAVLTKIRAHAAAIGLAVAEATVTNPAEVLEASRSLVIKGAGVFLNPGDNTLNVSFDSFVKVADQNAIPVFSVDSAFIEQGSLVVLGPDYYQTGYEGGSYLARVLRGEDPAGLPIVQTEKTLFMINMDVARKHGFALDKKIVRKAQKVIDSSKKDERPKKLALFLFSDHTIIHEAERGIMDELTQSGVLTRYNISVDTKNAQNEFSMAQSIVQDIVRRKYDYIITLSTPALQVTAQGNKTIPHVFGAVTDPFRMGVAKNPRDHLPQLTGLATLQPVETTLRVMREIFPEAKRLGIVWNAAEACSEACTYKAREAAEKYGFELLEANVSSTAEVLDALRSLLSRKIDLFITAGDNTVLMALGSIAKILREHKIPYFTNGPSDVRRGAFLSIGADYYEVGRETARVAVRVMGGEAPKDIPIQNCVPEKMFINERLAGEYGITVPEAVLKQASKIVR